MVSASACSMCSAPSAEAVTRPPLLTTCTAVSYRRPLASWPPAVSRLPAAWVPAAWASLKSAVIGTYQCKMFDPQPAYFKQLHKLIEFDVLKKANLKVAVGLGYGTGHGYLDPLLEKPGGKVTLFHNQRNP